MRFASATMGRLLYASRRPRTSNSPRRIQADGGGSGVYAAVLGRRAQRTFDVTASVAPSWPRLKRSPFAFAVTRRPRRCRSRCAPAYAG
jgi:hypothetical protein